MDGVAVGDRSDGCLNGITPIEFVVGIRQPLRVTTLWVRRDASKACPNLLNRDHSVEEGLQSKGRAFSAQGVRG